MEKTFYNIFKTFFKTGTLLLGGGYVIFPLLEYELTDKKKWIENEELCEFYALAQSIPGVIAVNMSAFTGYKLKGFFGALSAVSGIIMPSFLAIVIIAELLDAITELKLMQYIFQGVGTGVLMLIFLAVREIWQKSIKDIYTSLVFFFTFILSACFKVSPAVLVLAAIFTGIFRESKRRVDAAKLSHCTIKEKENDL